MLLISGNDGVSPTITVTDIDGGHRITIVDVNGEKSIDVMDGTNGTNGAAGAAAGFGTPTATIDANVGTPSVTVTASGANTAKVFAFAFKNLKGATGDKGDKGDTGASVSAINFVTTDGTITGGTCTLSDGTSVPITITTA